MRFIPVIIACLSLAAPALKAVTVPPPELSLYSDQPEYLKLKTQDACPLTYRLLETTLEYSQFNANRSFDANGQNISRGYRRDTLMWANLERGMGYGIELGLGVGYAGMLDQDFDLDADGIPNPTSGSNFTDLKFNLLWRFLNNKEMDRNLANFIQVVFPTGATNSPAYLEPGQGYLSVMDKLAFTGHFDDTTLNADLGGEVPAGNYITDNRGRALADLAWGWQLAQQFQPAVELSYEHDFFEVAPGTDQLSAALEAIVLWQPSVKMFVGLEQSLAGRNTDLGTTFYLKFVFLSAS